MNNVNPKNGLKNNNLQILDDRKELTTNPQDLENIFSLLKMKSTDSGSVLDKIKSIVNLLLYSEYYELLKKKCLQK